MTYPTIDNTLDIIDSFGVIARIEELRVERDAHDEGECGRSWAEEYPDDAEELRALEELQSEAEGYARDWRHGVQLIRDSYFEDSARELAEDLHGDALRRTEWPFSCIDWGYAANELKHDYMAVDFDGVDYWVR
jgi:hypothetical protein